MKNFFKIKEKKETYTHAEVEAILGEQKASIDENYKGYVSKEDYDKIIGELKPLKQKERTSSIKSLNETGKFINPKYMSDAIKLADIEEDDDEKTIKTKLKDLVKDREYLKFPEEDALEAKKTFGNKDKITKQPAETGKTIPKELPSNIANVV